MMKWLVGYVAVFLLAAPAAGYTVGHAAAARPVGTADAARLTRSVRVPIVIDNSPPVVLTVEPEEDPREAARGFLEEHGHAGNEELVAALVSSINLRHQAPPAHDSRRA